MDEIEHDEEILVEHEEVALSDHDKIVAELTESLKRERADNINILRRSAEDSQRYLNQGKVIVIKKIIGIIDTYEKAKEVLPENLKDDKYVEGLMKLITNLDDSLRDLGVERIKTEGEEFDPEMHMALNTIESTNKKEKSGFIAKELQSGYKLGETLIRPASVTVFA